MARMTELDAPKMVIAVLLGIMGLAIGVMAWLSMPEGTDGLVKALLVLFVLACIGPIFAVYFNWRAGLALSVVVALGTVIGLQVVLKKPHTVVETLVKQDSIN